MSFAVKEHGRFGAFHVSFILANEVYFHDSQSNAPDVHIYPWILATPLHDSPVVYFCVRHCVTGKIGLFSDRDIAGWTFENRL
jgi:hypothetical protein